MTFGRELPAGGKERQIFISALRDFSNRCEMPDLTPSCPFYEMRSSGAVCGEQCHDLLAEYGEQKTAAGIDLGAGLELHLRQRPRPRRGPDPNTRPFDAAEIELRDRDRPTDARHTVSLLREIVDQLLVPPLISDDKEGRAYAITASYEELRRRGFDEDILTGLMAEYLTQVLPVWLGLSFVAPDNEAVQNIAELVQQSNWSGVLSEWRRTQDAELSGAELFLALHRSALPELFARWLFSLDAQNLAEWRAPQSIEMMRSTSTVDKNRRATSAWLRDRFTGTYLHEWSDAGLREEWTYLHGDRVGCGPSREMALRRLKAEEVALEITQRSSVKWDREEVDQGRRVDVSNFTSVALEKLRAGQPEAAVVLLEGLCSISPDDPELVNNLGFCLIPVDLDRALEVLDRAWMLGERRNPITLANRLFVLREQGRHCDVVEQGRFISSCDHHAVGAYLWQTRADGPGFDLIRLVDVVAYSRQIVTSVESG